jgi:hypothetical protein
MKISAATVEALFGVIAAVGSVSCLSRADYNLPLFAFLYFFYFTVPKPKRDAQQRFLTILVACTCVQDLTWGLYWRSIWYDSRYDLDWGNLEKAFHRCVLVLCWVEMGLKVVTVFLMHQCRTQAQGEMQKPAGFTYD